MATTTSRSARYAKWLSIPLGLVLSAGIVWQASSAAFSDSVTSPDNSWTAGSVDLWSDHEGRLVFDAKNLVPGSTETKTVTVGYRGTLDADLSFYGTDFTGSDEALADHIHLKITGPTPWWSGEVFDGSLAEFGETHHNFDTGISAGVIAEHHSNRTGVFTFEYTLEENPAATTSINEVQGGTASLDFVLEAVQKTG